MPNGNEDYATGWLWGEPANWHAMNRALQDVSILLHYLGELPDARLLGYFKDTQVQLADTGARRSVPPCDDYAVFVRRLFQIASAFQTGRTELLPDEDQAKEAAGPCSAIAFVYWSRDFLAAVAAPATAQSIRLTDAYLVKRAWWLSLFRPPRSPPLAGEPAIPVSPDLSAPTRSRLARMLVFRVSFYELLTIGVAIMTVAISIYALSGRLILSNEQEMRETWKQLDTQLEAMEDKVFEPVHVPVTAETREHFEVTGLCELTREVAAEPSRAQVAESGKITSDASQSSSAPSLPPTKLYAMPHQAHLCADREKALLNLFMVTMHMQGWSSTVTRSLGRGFAYPFGVAPATVNSFAGESQNCFGLRPPNTKIADTAACQRVLWDDLARTRHVADSILGAITQYVLPVLYGFLGAMAAAMRWLQRKVDASLLSYNDHARLQQGAILGVLCGAVIGLFATFFGGTSGAGNIGVSAIALLAGYNVDGVFRFLDELSDRLFHPNPAPKTPPG